MGELVDFRPRTDAVRCADASRASADILFFTGVRIIRIEALEEASKGGRRQAGPRSGPSRKRLKPQEPRTARAPRPSSDRMESSDR